MRAWHVAAAAGAVAAIVWALPAAAQQGASQQSRQYVEAAAQSDAFEMFEAEAALTGSADPQVRAYAEMMLRDHGANAAGLRAAAADATVDPPAMQVGADQAALLAALQGLNGAEFDRAYAEQQALAHRSALTVQQAYATGGGDAGLRRLATQTSAVVARHLDAAERLKAALGS